MLQIPSFRVSVAPMMDWTDRHFRFFLRLITKHSLLYTEMVTTGAILKGKNSHRFLEFSTEELPLALQLGGDSPLDLSECAKIGENYGYSEINLNVGCPSDRVQSGSFGACLMKEPNLVADMVSKIKSKVKIPVTVKHRIGVNGKDSFEDLVNFVKSIKEAGVDRVIVHARIAILEGLSPKENRKIPPIRYEDVHRLKNEFPNLPIIINGEIKSLYDINHHLKKMDGVMIGRAAYENPYLFSQVDNLYFNTLDDPLTRGEVLLGLIPYLENQIKVGTKPHHVLRHILGLFHGIEGARKFRKLLTESMHSVNFESSILTEFTKEQKGVC